MKEMSLKAKNALDTIGNFSLTTDCEFYKGYMDGKTYFDYEDIILLSEGLSDAAAFMKEKKAELLEQSK